MEKFRVVHYINQFFGQIGGEDKAGIPPRAREGALPVGQAIQQESGGSFQIVRTIICGDNYAAEHLEELEPVVLSWVREAKPDLFLAGPAFAAGRYRMACGILCKASFFPVHPEPGPGRKALGSLGIGHPPSATRHLSGENSSLSGARSPRPGRA